MVALQALVTSCPKAEVAGLLALLRERLGGCFAGEDAGRGTARAAARVWAAVVAALLRRGGFPGPVREFTEDLLAALDRDGPVTDSVPLAFQVLLPSEIIGAQSSEAEAAARLPPLALQRLSLTTLPGLVQRAKAAAAAGPGRAVSASAALASAVALLCALPLEVSCGDCAEDLRWCVLVGLGNLKSVLQSEAAPASDGSAAAAQVLQLLVRAVKREASWVEDELHSVVPPLLLACTLHPVPLLRLAALQALIHLVRQSCGHLTPWKKQLEAALAKAVADRRKEVRHLAVVCLNSWHCSQVSEG